MTQPTTNARVSTAQARQTVRDLADTPDSLIVDEIAVAVAADITARHSSTWTAAHEAATLALLSGHTTSSQRRLVGRDELEDNADGVINHMLRHAAVEAMSARLSLVGPVDVLIEEAPRDAAGPGPLWSTRSLADLTRIPEHVTVLSVCVTIPARWLLLGDLA